MSSAKVASICKLLTVIISFRWSWFWWLLRFDLVFLLISAWLSCLVLFAEQLFSATPRLLLFVGTAKLCCASQLEVRRGLLRVAPSGAKEIDFGGGLVLSLPSQVKKCRTDAGNLLELTIIEEFRGVLLSNICWNLCRYVLFLFCSLWKMDLFLGLSS